MMKTKAAFRALREECGLTQADVASQADVRVLTVKRWESHNINDCMPPDDVWLLLLERRDALEEEARAAVEAIKRMHRGNEPVAIRYYRTQEQLDEVQLDRDRPVGYVNAVTRRCMQLLSELRIPYDVFYPEQMTVVEGEPYDYGVAKNLASS